jgi:hypothetical protein
MSVGINCRLIRCCGIRTKLLLLYELETPRGGLQKMIRLSVVWGAHGQGRRGKVYE